MCKKKTKIAKIDKNLSPRLQNLFKTPMTYVEESIAKIKRISAFQQMQKKRLLDAQSQQVEGGSFEFLFILHFQMNAAYAQYKSMKAKFQQLQVEAKAIQIKTNKLNASAKEKEELIEILTELLEKCEQEDVASGVPPSRPPKRKRIDLLDGQAAHSSGNFTPSLTLPFENNQNSTPFETIKAGSLTNPLSSFRRLISI